MNVVKEISRINELEIRNEINLSGSWHDQYKDSAYIFIGGIPYDLSEQDVICVFSQYGEVVDFNLVRDKETGKSKGFAFLAYEDQRSTVLAVDNFNGAKLLGRVLRVDHVLHYKKPKKNEDEEEEEEEYQIAPQGVLPEEATKQSKKMTKLLETLDPDDPMKDYLIEKQERKDRKKHRKHKHHHRHSHKHRKDKNEQEEEKEDININSNEKSNIKNESEKNLEKNRNSSTIRESRRSRSRSPSRDRYKSRYRSSRSRDRSRDRSRNRSRDRSRDRDSKYRRNRSYSRERYRH